MSTSAQMLLYFLKLSYRQDINTVHCDFRQRPTTIREVEEEDVFTSVGIRKEYISFRKMRNRYLQSTTSIESEKQSQRIGFHI